MKRIAIVLLAVMLMSLTVATAEADKPFAGTELVVYNWYDYIDPAVLEMFEDETGIKVTYVNFTQNEDMYARLEAGAGAYDVIFPSDYMIERLIKEDRLETLNMDNIPNMANVLDSLRNPSYDPDNAHSVPYMWGTLGILYNEDMVSMPITSWTSLFDGEYKGSIFMMNSLRDTIGLAQPQMPKRIGKIIKQEIWIYLSYTRIRRASSSWTLLKTGYATLSRAPIIVPFAIPGN